MQSLLDAAPGARYSDVNAEKAGGVTYTPKELADFVARAIVGAAGAWANNQPIRLLDPAVGDGELLMSLLAQLDRPGMPAIEAHGFETDQQALNLASARIRQRFPKASLRLTHGDFLKFVVEQVRPQDKGGLFEDRTAPAYDLNHREPALCSNADHGRRACTTPGRTVRPGWQG